MDRFLPPLLFAFAIAANALKAIAVKIYVITFATAEWACLNFKPAFPHTYFAHF